MTIAKEQGKNKKFWFDLYQYIAPLILTPAAIFLWSETYGGNVYLVTLAVGIPIFYAYIVPGIGTNILKLWKFNSPLMLGNFRIHHGFIFGSTTSVLVWLVAHQPVHGYFDILISAFIVGSVLALWNTIYDIKAIEAGVVKVFNQPYAEKKGAEAIVMDYGPMIFGFFGGVYTIGLKSAELLFGTGGLGFREGLGMFLLTLTLSILVPVTLFVRSSLKRHGHSGLSPKYQNSESERHFK